MQAKVGDLCVGVTELPDSGGFRIDLIRSNQPPISSLHELIAPSDQPIIVLDVETSGLSPFQDRVIEIAVLIIGPKDRWMWSSLVRPAPLPLLSSTIVALTGITSEMLADAPVSASVFSAFYQLCGVNPLVLGHNVAFDIQFLTSEFARIGLKWLPIPLCTLNLARQLRFRANFPALGHRLSLDALCALWGVTRPARHRAADDVLATEQIALRLLAEADVHGLDIQELARLPKQVRARSTTSGSHACDEIDDTVSGSPKAKPLNAARGYSDFSMSVHSRRNSMALSEQMFSSRNLFWGKIDCDASRWLSLTCHSLDVALVFRALCDLPRVRHTLHNAAGSALSEVQCDRLGVLALLHDVGKANLGFQRKVFDLKAPRAGHIRELAPMFDPEWFDSELQEQFAQALPPELPEWFADYTSCYSYLLASFSHHGRPVQFQGETTGVGGVGAKALWRPRGAWDPMHAIREISRCARVAFPQAFVSGNEPLPQSPRLHHRFAGLLMLADWLGSNQTWFPMEDATTEERLCHDRDVIPRVLRAVGLDPMAARAALSSELRNFEARFTRSPRPLQAAIDRLDPRDDLSRLLVAESETGSGKTEAALNWYFKLFAAGQVDSLYFALPTRVAARELYERVRDTIARWYPDPRLRPATVLAVPGYAQVDGEALQAALPTQSDAQLWQEDDKLRRHERQWAAERPKRFLAASVAVGTIDQVLLSTVRTSHAHLRSVCLDRGLLVVDEVHASDLYMSRLLEGLLSHHLSVGGHAMLLSATLGSEGRRRYVVAGGGSASPQSMEVAQDTPYPALTRLDGAVEALERATTPSKLVTFDMVAVALTPESIAPRIIAALQTGARVLVVMNTVNRANELHRHLERHPEMKQEWLFACEGTVCTHHGRFAPPDREFLDGAVSQRLGQGSAPGPLLLIGTQTLEQSLDIDADFLVTDLAPADVLLQRVGRLHRHERDRPKGYESSACLVLVSDGTLEDALEESGRVRREFSRMGYGSVYDMRALELTRRLLEQSPLVQIPQENRRLVEAVTHPEAHRALDTDRWKRHAQIVEGEEMAEAFAARMAGAVPFYDQPFGEFQFIEMGERVATRLGAGSLQLPLSRRITSPFGVTLEEIVIPEHMAPNEPVESVLIEAQDASGSLLVCGARRYRYSRYGLELEETP